MGKKNQDTNSTSAVLIATYKLIPAPILVPKLPFILRSPEELESLDKSNSPALASNMIFNFALSTLPKNFANSNKVMLIIPCSNLPKDFKDKALGNPCNINIFGAFLTLENFKPTILLPKSMQNTYKESDLNFIASISVTTVYYDDKISLSQAFSDYAKANKIPIFEPTDSRETNFRVINDDAKHIFSAKDIFSTIFEKDNFCTDIEAHPLILMQDILRFLDNERTKGRKSISLKYDKDMAKIEDFIKHKSSRAFYGNKSEYDEIIKVFKLIFNNKTTMNNETILKIDISEMQKCINSRQNTLTKLRRSKFFENYNKFIFSGGFCIFHIKNFLSAVFKKCYHAFSFLINKLKGINFKDLALNFFREIHEFSPEKIAKNLSKYEENCIYSNAYTKRKKHSSPVEKDTDNLTYTNRHTQAILNNRNAKPNKER